MALTRSLLKGMGLTDEQIGAVIDAHSETVTALKEERDEYKEDAKKLKDVQKELDDLKADTSSDDWKKKYEKEHSDFEAFKTAEADKAKKETIRSAYRALLKEAGVSEKRIDSVMKVADLTKVELSDDGKLKDSDKLTEGIKTEWADFIEKSNTQGAGTNNPPSNDNGGSDLGSLSMAEYIAARKNM